jgi:hypothetical protein
MDVYGCPLLFHTLMVIVYEKYNDMLIGSSLLFVHSDACVKSIRSIEVCQSRAPYFLYAALHV